MFTKRLHDLGVTKAALADRAGVRRETVSRWREAPPRWAIELLHKLGLNKTDSTLPTAREPPRRVLL